MFRIRLCAYLLCSLLAAWTLLLGAGANTASAACLCRVVAASPHVTVNGEPVVAGKDVPCDALLSAEKEGHLTLQGGMTLTLSAGASMSLPPALCANTGSAGDAGQAPPARLRGVVRLAALSDKGDKDGKGAAYNVPAAFRSGEDTPTQYGVVENVAGNAMLYIKDAAPLRLKKAMRLKSGERIQTGSDGFVLLRHVDGSALMLGADQILTLPAVPDTAE